MKAPNRKSAERSNAAKQRVITLLDAIADLQIGDLYEVLHLDEMMPMLDLDDNCKFGMDKGGKIKLLPGMPKARSLIDRVKTGKSLVRILESQLTWVLAFGEAGLVSYRKTKETKENLEVEGSRRAAGAMLRKRLFQSRPRAPTLLPLEIRNNSDLGQGGRLSAISVSCRIDPFVSFGTPLVDELAFGRPKRFEDRVDPEGHAFGF